MRQRFIFAFVTVLTVPLLFPRNTRKVPVVFELAPVANESCSPSECNFVALPRGSRSTFCSCKCPREFCGLACEYECSGTRSELPSLNYGYDQQLIQEKLRVTNIPYISSWSAEHHVGLEIAANGVLIACNRGVQIAVDFKSREVIRMSFPHYFVNRNAIPGWIGAWDVRERTHNLLTTHNISVSRTLKLTSSHNSTVFCVFSARLPGTGHFFHDVLTVLGKFFQLFGDVSQDISLLLVDPGQCTQRICADVVYWPLRFLNVSVTFLPPDQVMFAERAIFVMAEETPTPWSVALINQIIWPRVKQAFNGYPTPRRIVMIKALGTGYVSPKNGFFMTEKFLSLLRENSFFYVDCETTPVAERMWYVNHAEDVLVSWGTLGDTMLALRAENITSMRVKMLYHTGYGDEYRYVVQRKKARKILYRKRQVLLNGTATTVTDVERFVDHLSRNSVLHFRSIQMVMIDNNNLDALSASDLFGSSG